MALSLRWVDHSQTEQIALTRLRCYGSASNELDRFRERLERDPRAGEKDFLLAEENGQAIGTATHYPMVLWARGSAFACQGVAWVGAIKTMRRRGKDAPGVASSIMLEMLRHARERGDVLSALMPFRASYYEHFGYGIVERRCEWTLPLATLPTGAFDGIRFYTPDDFDARLASLRSVVSHGQCDIERSDAFWKASLASAEEGFQIVDRPDPHGPVLGAMLMTNGTINGKDGLKISDHWYQDIPALRRQLSFLSSLRDQYAAVQMVLPIDVRLNWLLKETQLPHRPVTHATAEARPYVRMQVRVLDHIKFLSGLNLPDDVAGSATVSILESEGYRSTLRVDVEHGHATATPSNVSPDYECTDRVWAAVVCGNLSASEARSHGLATGSDRATGCLDLLARGPAPFCHETF